MLGTYAAFGRAAFQQQLAYRVANWAGLFTNVFFLFFRAYLVEACYTADQAIGGLTVLQSVTYVTVTQAILMVVPMWGTVGLSAQVYTGQIAISMLRPVDFFGMKMAERLGVSAYYLLVRMSPLLAIGLAAGVLALPASVPLLAGFVASMLLGAWIAVAILFLIEVSSFWLESDKGVRYLVHGASMLPSGLILPVAWFPDAIQQVFRATPFAYTLNLPAEIWLGVHSSLTTALLVQLGWAVALTVACKIAFDRGTARLQVVGG